MTILNRPSSQHANYYQLLAIEPSASLKDIEKAYKRQALVHHPDRNPNHSQNQSTGNFQKIVEAYEVLRDPIKRIKYDLKLSKAAGAASSPHGIRPSKQEPSRTTDLFGYPGETPKHVPALHRRSVSTTPSFLFRQPSAETSNRDGQDVHTKSSSQIRRLFCGSPPTLSSEPQKPFSQKIKLKDLDSLQLDINLRPKPDPRPSHPIDRRSQNRSTPLDPSSSAAAPDPYLTFERAWGKNLDAIIDGIIDREIEQKRNLNRKSHTDPPPTDPKPRIVHRSATVRSADSDYRSTAYHIPQQRPRSASGNFVMDRDQFPPSRGPQNGPVQIPRQMECPAGDIKSYAPPSSHDVRSRRMSTGRENVFSSSPVHGSHQLYRQMSGSGPSSSSIPFMHDRGRNSTASPIHPTSSSPQELPFFPGPAHSSERNRASSTFGREFRPSSLSSAPFMQDRARGSPAGPANPVSSSPQENAFLPGPAYGADRCRPSSGMGREFREVIIRFERERDGSTRLSKEMKSRTIDLDGTVHDRYRRQRAAAVK